jgi:hypothetical protein
MFVDQQQIKKDSCNLFLFVAAAATPFSVVAVFTMAAIFCRNSREG